MRTASIHLQHAHCLISLANQLFPIILRKHTFEAERAGMIQITARGEGAPTFFGRPGGSTCWPGALVTPSLLRVCACVCVRMCVSACVQAYVRVCTRALYCVCV